MRLVFVLGLLALLSLSAGVSASSGTTCASCTLVVSLLEQIAILRKTDIKGAVSVLCSAIAPSHEKIAALCTGLLDTMAPVVQADFDKLLTPDYTCANTLGMCKDFAQCKLYDQWPPKGIKSLADSIPATPIPTFRRVSGGEQALQEKLAELERAAISETPFYDMLSALFNVNGPGKGPHLPLFDDDNDRYSTFPYLRGTHWRGKDCDDKNPNVYPGRAVDTVGPNKDHNCNGIFGVDENGVPYEDKFCKNTGQRGLIVLGDSATAHFSIPPDWITPAAISNKTYSNFLPTVLNELDWPACSAYTAHLNVSDCPPTGGLPLNSIYLMMRERNRCNHRDYANIGVNGASTNNMRPPNGVIAAMKPRNGTDHPATVFYALIGNDVCKHHHSFDAMTKPEVFEDNVLAALDYLDERLPPNSWVIFVGMVDGRVLFDAMGHLTHPIGTTYAQFYDYLNCLDVNPCWGWLNTNATVRNLTTEHAMRLNQIYPKIIKERQGTYKNFKMHYVFADMQEEIKKWVAKGGKPSDLIEKVDGFHPSTLGNMLIAQALWSRLLNEVPDALGPVNPNNAAIKAIFGDQGGH